jgi:hypothetical protein
MFSCLLTQPDRNNPFETPATQSISDTVLDRHVQEILNSKHPHTSQLGPGVCEGYQTLFRKIGPDDLAKLRMHQNDGIALQAAWQEVALTVPEKEPKKAVRPDPQKLAWFLGFLEGRLHVQAPQWWAVCLLDTRANRRGNMYSGASIKDTSGDSGTSRPTRDMTSKTNTDQTIRLRHPEYAEPGVRLQNVSGRTVLVIGLESIPLPDELLHKSNSGELFDHISVLASTNCVYVAVHDDVGFPYKLACLDRVSGKIIWKSDVWGTWWGFGSGVHIMIVAIVELDNRVIVFGWGSTGMNVEGFCADDGSNLFRFSTSYIATGQ